MTIAVDMGRKATKTNKQTTLYGRNPVSFAICATIVKALDQEKVLIKQLLLKFMSQIL